ncbi:mpv17-like protein 2 [Amyelois transitella]|uniref:mpv17-like protein 2 n=1 Tax=Amyelois transitella TaxID=680683 RepID=UPI00299041DB|nr:mpv17-like protein 2 [Amyelois transitella]XP_013187770.2 mpv17-like protein 2 [Amyelois transitella]
MCLHIFKMFSKGCIRVKQTLNLLQTHRRPLSTFRRGVNFFFKKNLLFTNSITSGGFMFLGDMIQQEIEYHAKIIPYRYDWARLGRMFIVGTLVGPLHHFYYIQLDKILPQNNLKTVAMKIICDQVFASPATIVCFFYGMGVLERKSFAQSTEEIGQKFKYVYLGDWLFWPPVQFVNFYYLPTEYRVFYINIATMVFNVFLSYMKHFDQH